MYKKRNFERKVTETPNFQGRCTPVWYTSHVSDAERTVRSGRDKHQKMRQSAGTTMAFVTWRHVPRGTCHVPPREPLAKPYRKDQIFERKVTETPNFQGRCTPVWYTSHVSDDSIGSKLCPQGTILFFSLMPSSSETLWPIDTKLMPFDAV